MKRSALIIHGGAGAREGAHTNSARYAESLRRILPQAWRTMGSAGAREAVLHAVRLLEDDPLFNAGLGSRLQRDGVARMSAALMGGAERQFCGVVNVEAVRHPIDVAAAAERRATGGSVAAAPPISPLRIVGCAFQSRCHRVVSIPAKPP